MHILIVKTSSLGDILQTLPAVEFITKLHPEAIIDWVVEKEAADIAAIYPKIHRLIIYDRDQKKFPLSLFQKKFLSELRLTHYDLLFDFQGNSKSGWITFLARAKKKIGFNAVAVSEWPNLLATQVRFGIEHTKSIRDQYIQLVEKFFQKKLTGLQKDTLHLLDTKESLKSKKIPIVLVAPFSAKRNKILPLPELLHPLLNFLLKDLGCKFVFLSGSPEEKKVADSLSLAYEKNLIKNLYRPSLSELYRLVKDDVDLVIAADSLPLHLAALCAIPKICFFGPSLSHIYAPQDEYCLAFQGHCPKKESFEKRCPNMGHCVENGCIRSFSLPQILEKIHHWPPYLQLKARL